MIQTSRFPRYLFIALSPIFFLGLFSVASCKPAVVSSTEQRERAITQLRQALDRSGGKLSDDELIAFERNYPNTRMSALARFLRAYNHFSARDFAGSAPLFDEAMIKEGGLGDYALYYQGSAYRETGNNERARAAFLLLVEKYPQSIYHRDAQIAAGDIALKSNDAKTAIKELDKLADAKDPAALLITAQSYEQLNKIDKAVDYYRKLYYEVPESGESEAAGTRLTALGYPIPEGGKDGFKLAQTRADALFEAGQFGRAIDAYNLLLTKFPDQNFKPRNALRFGISLNALSRYRDAAAQLSTVPASEKDLYTDARYHLARAYLKQKLMAQFSDVATQLLTKPLTPPERGSELLMALIDYNKNTAVGERYRNQLIKEYPQTKEADQVSYQAAWKIHLDRRYQDASDALIAHLANFPNTDMRGSATFWAGRDAERIGNPARAAALYEALLRRYRSGYYGYLADQRLREFKKRENFTPEQPAENSILARALATIKPAAPLPETATEKADVRLQHAESLQIIRLYDLAFTELELARKDAPNSAKINFAIASIHSARGDTLKAVQTLQRAHPDYLLYQGNEASREVFEIFFPLIEWQTIKTEAARYKLDPFIVAGLIRQESVFDPRVRSRANAYGLMQLLPATGKMVAHKAGSGSITTEQLYNPQLNIRLGTAYLASLFDKYGRIEYAAAAYNGGPGRVDRWLQTLPSDLDDWVEAIPITETRLYVQGVLRNAGHYRRIYGNTNNSGQ